MAAMPKGYARYALGVMVAINFLNYMDRYIPTAVSPIIQKEFHLSLTQVGLLATAFLLVYALTAVPFGFWADRGIRKNVIAIGIAIWSVATVMTAFVGNFAQLFLTRAVVGIGEASYYPAGTSLLADHFPKASRARAMSIWNAGTAVGIAVGFVGAGIIAEKTSWRVAFLVAAVPGLILAVMAWRMREPLRGAAEERGPQVEVLKAATLRTFAGLLRIRSLLVAVLAQTLLFWVLGANVTFLPIFLTQRFAVSPGTASTISGGVIVVGGLAGTLVGGWLADRRNRVSPRGNFEVPIVGFVLAAVFIALALLAPTLTLFVPCFLLSVVFIYFYSGPLTAIGQNVVHPGLRASAVTMLLLVGHLFGDSWSPTAVGALADSIGSLRNALLITSPTVMLGAAAVAAWGLSSISSDTQRMEDDWAAQSPGSAAAPIG